jgi:hypothetical protein
MENLYMFTKIKQEKVSYQVFSYVREKNIHGTPIPYES